MEFNKPDCSTWNIWQGKEIEGTTDIGVNTLFVRRGNPGPYLWGFERVWFCKEFVREQGEDALAAIRTTLHLDKKVCIEVELEDMALIANAGLEKAQLYLKIEANLKHGDHICVGTAFKDEAFRMGTGAGVLPGQYAEDVRIE